MQFDANITIHSFQESSFTAEAWDEFVRKSDNGTLFHERLFLSYHPVDRFTDASLYFERNDKVFSVFPAVSIVRNGKKILSSHGGASYGGFVYPGELNIRDSFQMVELLVEYAKKHAFDGIQITIPPIIYSKHLSNYIDFALIKNGFNYLKRDISSVVDLRFNNEADILSGFRPETRTALNKSLKSGIVIKECTDYEAYYTILKNNLRMRHDVNPTHSLAELQELAYRYPDRISLWGAFLHDTMIAGVCNFSANDQVVLAFYISHDEAYQEYRAVNQLFYTIMKTYSQKNFSYLDFGIFTVNMEPNWGLGRFKENFGSRGIFRDTLFLEL